eukprot:1436652-Amphidinium_carterae.1
MGKSPGQDQIIPEFLRYLPVASLDHLLHTFNAMAASCTLPASWQRVLLVPLAKPKKNVHDPGSYRFIGLTSYLCKVFESLLQEVLHPHVGDLHHA